ncbi:Uncharacterized protein OBRU01_04091 [Operophtera brumata]|uniref:Glycosyltransferase 2-like domain-containing protein n=1 Tax=Operophtera brumata TaxID=104452 RepID=A0A0L7LLI8_OPEBR|nr:Uncharacterized protein OBRU01_04091 [Operophtera brumata]
MTPSHYVRTRLPPDLIRIVRLPDRIGVTQARMAGSRSATGSVLIFLDSHCEGAPDWMRPLLHRIKHRRDAVLTPVIDVINEHTFKYQARDVQWDSAPEREKKRRGSNISPTRRVH